jgi:hypothetical protein
MTQGKDNETLGKVLGLLAITTATNWHLQVAAEALEKLQLNETLPQPTVTETVTPDLVAVTATATKDLGGYG